jgi:hypothetical protein
MKVQRMRKDPNRVIPVMNVSVICIWFLFGAIEPPTIPATSTGTGGESIGEPNKDKHGAFEQPAITNVRTIIRPIFARRTIKG